MSRSTCRELIIPLAQAASADDNSPYAPEPDEAKVSCPVREWRRGG
ncbi:MAG: hypothetical protein JXA13_02515 [Anaerolineales bacterium]|nr:hypothetical protein [Anaerolineales bacterium]